jgi:hypothetical protein
MRHIVDPRQNRLFDPFAGLMSPPAKRLIAEGWQGVVRHCLLQVMPVPELARKFDPVIGAPTKELYSMAGLVFLTDFFDWTSAEAAEAYMLNLGVQYALNLDPGAAVAARTIERYQRLFREEDLPATVFRQVTAALAELLELDVSKQRLDSTHVFSQMATFGRTKLMAVAIKRFLTQVKRHARDRYDALPEDLRSRYERAESKLFSHAKDVEGRKRSRQQAAEDLRWVMEHFADQADITNRSTYKILAKIFSEQCEIVADKVEVRTQTGGNRIQNPSDPDATYDGHKGVGYQVQISETYSADNEVQLILATLPQTACERDEAAVSLILEQLKDWNVLPEEMPADTAYGSDENVQLAAAYGVELIAPIAGRTPTALPPDVLTVDDFAIDERTGQVDACPQSHVPLRVERDAAAQRTLVEMPAETCQGCPLLALCPITKTRDGRYELEFTDKEQRLAARRREQATEVFQERYAPRAGIESTNSGLKRREGLGKLRVRGRGSVFRVLYHKIAGWNVLRAAASGKVRAWVAAQVAKTLGIGAAAQTGQPCAVNLAIVGRDYRVPHRPSSQNPSFSVAVAV